MDALNVEKVQVNKIAVFVDIVCKHFKTLKENGVDEIQYWLLIVKEDVNEQCNIEFSRKTLNKLNKMKASICIEFMLDENLK